MTQNKIPKYSSVRWAALAVGAIIIGYLIGISSISKGKLSDGDSYMLLIYNQITYMDIENWSASQTDITVTGSGIFPQSPDVSGDKPRAFILFSASSRAIADQVVSTSPGYDSMAQLRTIKKQE